MTDRIEIPMDKTDLVLARKNAGMSNPSLEFGSDGNIVPRNKDSSGLYTVTVRKSSNEYKKGEDGLPGLPKKAQSLKACKGKKGCEFLECVEEALGKTPSHLQKLKDKCSIK